MCHESSVRRAGLTSVLYPSEPRTYSGQRMVKAVARAIHVLCAGTFVGAYILESDPAQRSSWLFAAVISGAIILALDLYETSAFLFQVRGLVVAAKVAALTALPHVEPFGDWLLGAIVILSVASSHASSEVRHHLVFGRERLRGATTKG